MNPKQEIFDALYQFEECQRVLDVGCGLPVPTLPVPIYYTPIDLKINGDWYDYEPRDYDIIIANDLFPNVDQRLELFLSRYLPHCKEMRLSLTYFDEPKWYRAKRVDGDEVLTVLAWDLLNIRNTIYATGLQMTDIKTKKFPGTFPNGRRVLLVWLKGGS